LLAAVLLFGATGALAQTRGGTAVIIIDSNPETLNAAITTGTEPGDIGAKVFEGLVWVDANHQAQPSLATSWSVSPDNKTYTFTLRRGVKWHDGRDFTSADVKFTYDEALTKLHPRTQNTMRRLEPVLEMPDPQTVVVKLKETFAPFVSIQTPFEAPIIPRHVYADGDLKAHPANEKPVGTGPFKFAEWNRGQAVRLVRNDAYWEAGRPYLDALVFQIVPQGPNRSTALETGEGDFLYQFYVSRPDVRRLAANARIQAKQGSATPAVYFMMMNTSKPALANKLARQALAHAINRDLQVAQAMDGHARPGYGAFGDGFPWLLNADVAYAKKYPLDVNKAKELLAAAKVDTAAPLNLAFDPARPMFNSGGQIIRDNLRQIGLTVNLVPLERSVMIQKVFTERDFDLTLQSFTSSGDPSIGYHRMYVTNAGRAQFVNATGYSNKEVDDLLGRAAVAADKAARARLYRQAQEILNEDLPTLVLYDEVGTDLASRKLNGLWKGIDGRDRWGDVWMSR
jgi:peptide/nickel transport system substrate-binding protein